MKIAVCDDMQAERELLIPILRAYFAERGLDASIYEFESGEALTAAFSSGLFDIVFMDIYMDGMTGIDTARLLRSADKECVIIFTTTSREHGADAYDLDAFYYIVKPFEKDKLFSVMDKWYANFCEVRTVRFKLGRTECEICIRDILYIDVQGRNCTVHTGAESIITSTPLSAVETLLPDGEFVRTIRYCLAALRHITFIGEDSLTLSNGEKLPVSRRERDNVKQRLAAYRLRALRRR